MSRVAKGTQAAVSSCWTFKPLAPKEMEASLWIG